MSIQAASGSFPVVTQQPPLFGHAVMADLATSNTWSSGVQALVPVSIQPTPLDARWSVLGWSLEYAASIYENINSGQPGPSGLIGRLYGGLTRLPAGGPVVSPLQPIPDASLVDLLYDGSQDPLPQDPLTTQGELALPRRVHSFQLPQPIAVTQMDALSMGLWLTPSLLSSVPATFHNLALQVAVNSAYYTVTYDDGR